MAKVVTPNKPVIVNPLKQSQTLGAALAFLGLKGMMPLLHGSQGCTLPLPKLYWCGISEKRYPFPRQR